MIARIWRGWTKRDDAQAYAEYVRSTGLVGYRQTPGNRGAYILQRDEGDRTEIITLSFWESLEAVKGFAGEEIERAVFYPEDDRYLVDRDLTVTHFRVTE
jgi:heme-degrading monooxygenase HmoA